MRVLMLAPHPQIRTPLQKHTPQLVAGLRDLGCVVTLAGWGRHRERESLPEKVFGRVDDLRNVRRVLRADRYDLLVVKTAHDWSTLSRDIPLLLATRSLCRRQVLQFHGCFVDRLVAPGHAAFKAASALLLRCVDAVLVLSSEEQRQWLSFFPGGRVYVVRNPFVASAGTPPVGDRGRFGVPAQVPLLLFVGRLLAQKGVFELVEALRRVVARTPCHLLMAGDGSDGDELRQWITAAGLTAHVTFAGYLEGEAFRAALSCADVFVLPSWTEGFPFSMLEAMDAGLPVVTTNIRGMADHVIDGVHGFLTPVRDAGALADAIDRMLADAELRRKMGAANREKVREFAPDVVARQYRDVLEAVLSQPHAGWRHDPVEVS